MVRRYDGSADGSLSFVSGRANLTSPLPKAVGFYGLRKGKHSFERRECQRLLARMKKRAHVISRHRY